MSRAALGWVLVLMLMTGGCGPLPQRTAPDPDLVIGGRAYTTCSALCRERGMCREVPDNQGHPQPVIHTRAQPGGRGVALKYLEVGAPVMLHDVQINWTRDGLDRLYGDALYLVSSPSWEAEDRYWVPVYCLSPEPSGRGD